MCLPVLLLPRVHGGFTYSGGILSRCSAVSGVAKKPQRFFQTSDLEAIIPFRFIPVFTLSTVFLLIYTHHYMLKVREVLLVKCQCVGVSVVGGGGRSEMFCRMEVKHVVVM